MKSLVFVLGVILVLGIIASIKTQSTKALQTFWQKLTSTFEAIEEFKKCENDYEYNTAVVVDANDSDGIITKIAGGKYAKLGDFPYMTVVHHLLGNGLLGQCGGTIISTRWILTAAHYVEEHPRKFLVVFGVIDKSGIGYDWLRGPGVSMITNRAFVHPQYTEGHNDIALLYMPREILFSNTVQPIRLAFYENSFTNREAHVIGWGKDNMISRGTKKRLKYATLPVIENNICNRYWYITSKHVCTSAGLGRDACQGDSGGPLVITQDGQDIQIGIVSYGDAFCPSNLPGVFTRVSSYMDWIHEITHLY